MDDLISRRMVMALAKDIYVPIKDGTVYKHRCIDPDAVKELPSAQPEIKCIANITLTDEQVKDAFEKARCNILSAQPEIIHCESCEHWKNEHICECLSRHGTFKTPKNFYCGYGKAK